MRWEHVLLNGHGGQIQVAKGKSKAARRPLPMVPAVYEALKARYEVQGGPAVGWVFPTGSASGHMQETSAKKWHAKALEVSKVEPFEPYCLRHTFGMHGSKVRCVCVSSHHGTLENLCHGKIR